MAATPPIDPKTIITPDAFTVAPELIGVPLANPWRRLAAILLDLIPVAILVSAGGSLLLGLIASIALWRASSPAQNEGLVKRSTRFTLRIGAALLVFFVVRGLYGWVSGGNGDEDPSEVSVNGIDLGLGDALAAIPIARLASATDSATAADAAAQVSTWLETADMDADDKEDMVDELLDGLEGPALAAARAALGSLTFEEEEPVDADSVALRYAAALEAEDTVAIPAVRRELRNALAGEDLRRMDRRIDALERSNERLEEELDEERNRSIGIIAFLRGISEDLGIGFGWSAVYFTSFLALWSGQTPGKRVVGIRVIQLANRPITWWGAFERFGGYAASLSTGLLGFAQILWDRNRQGLHDKVLGTVVVRERDFRAHMVARNEIPPRKAR